MLLKYLVIGVCLLQISTISSMGNAAKAVSSASSLVFPPHVNWLLFRNIIGQGNVNEFIGLLRHLPSWDINTNHIDDEGNTVLHLLARQGQAEMIALADIMLDTKLNTQVKNQVGLSVMQLAESCGKSEVCSLLGSLQGDAYESLLHALNTDQQEAVPTMLRANKHLEDNGFPSILTLDSGINLYKRQQLVKLAIMKKNLNEVYDNLMASNFEHDYMDFSAAIHNNNLHVINYLLKQGYYDEKLIKDAIRYGSTEVVDAILDFKKDSHSKENYSHYLDIAIEERRFLIAMRLIGRGADVHAIEQSKWAELDVDIRKMNSFYIQDIILEALDAHANIFHSDYINKNDYEGIRGFVSRVRSEEKNDLLNWRSRTGKKPLDAALQAGHYEVAAVLLWEVKGINYYDPIINRSPLMLAVESGNLEMVKEVLGSGARVYFRSNVDALYTLGSIAEERVAAGGVSLKKSVIDEMADILISTLNAEEMEEAIAAAERWHHKWLEDTLRRHEIE